MFLLTLIIGFPILMWLSGTYLGWMADSTESTRRMVSRAIMMIAIIIIAMPATLLAVRRDVKKQEEQKNAALNEERERIAAIVSEARQRDAERQHLLCPSCGGSGQKIEGELCPTCGGRGTRDGEPCSPCEASDAPAPTEEEKDNIL